MSRLLPTGKVPVDDTAGRACRSPPEAAGSQRGCRGRRPRLQVRQQARRLDPLFQSSQRVTSTPLPSIPHRWTTASGNGKTTPLTPACLVVMVSNPNPGPVQRRNRNNPKKKCPGTVQGMRISGDEQFRSGSPARLPVSAVQWKMEGGRRESQVRCTAWFGEAVHSAAASRAPRPARASAE